ncbi:MAG: hypothetical protein AMS20_04315 [Gemmatimonas sp. SG8_28]|jgi:hypothetical protein|nr:MAG: hypothetical protein AMS20_04315 [Gemmatimonas sp. SG8_28]
MPSPSTVLLALLVIGAVIWVVRRMRDDGSSDRSEEEDVDRDVLEAAEREVRDLDAFSAPEDAEDELPDWGPGAPR